jgi:hypothetical protein
MIPCWRETEQKTKQKTKQKEEKEEENEKLGKQVIRNEDTYFLDQQYPKSQISRLCHPKQQSGSKRQLFRFNEKRFCLIRKRRKKKKKEANLQLCSLDTHEIDPSQT